MSTHADFAAVLFDLGRTAPADLFSSPAPDSRFAVYRNNVISSLLGALADSYPVALQLVGEAFFSAMGLAYVQSNPPRSRLLVEYGEDFATFIESFEPAASLPYLADVARLERLRIRAYHAADSNVVGHAAIAELLAQPECLVELRLSLHPSLSILQSDFAICSLWQAHQHDGEIATVDLWRPERALVLRCGLAVELLAVDPGTCAFIQALQSGLPLGQAAGQGLQASVDFDLGHCLALLIAKAAITQLHTP